MSDVHLSAWIVQRARGVYLARVSEDEYGTEDYDAFPTVERAKRWCAEWHDLERLSWEHTPAVEAEARWATWNWEGQRRA